MPFPVIHMDGISSRGTLYNDLSARMIVSGVPNGNGFRGKPLDSMVLPWPSDDEPMRTECNCVSRHE